MKGEIFFGKSQSDKFWNLKIQVKTLPSRDLRTTYICHYPLDFQILFIFILFFIKKTNWECIVKIETHSFKILPKGKESEKTSLNSQ